MWPFVKRDMHVHMTATLVRAQPGDTLLVSLPPDWDPKLIRGFSDFVRENKLLPEGVRLCAVPSSHPPVLISSQPEPKAQEDGGDGDK